MDEFVGSPGDDNTSPGDWFCPQRSIRDTALLEMGRQLLEEAKAGNAGNVKGLVIAGAPFTADWIGTSPLHWSAQANNVEITELLLKSGISQDARNKVDRTPLHVASHLGHPEIVKLLLAFGSDPNSQDMLHMTPLHWAAESGNKEVVRLLLYHGARTDVLSKFNKVPLDCAEDKKQLGVIKVFEEIKSLANSGQLEALQSQVKKDALALHKRVKGKNGFQTNEDSSKPKKLKLDLSQNKFDGSVSNKPRVLIELSDRKMSGLSSNRGMLCEDNIKKEKLSTDNNFGTNSRVYFNGEISDDSENSLFSSNENSTKQFPKIKIEQNQQKFKFNLPQRKFDDPTSNKPRVLIEFSDKQRSSLSNGGVPQEINIKKERLTTDNGPENKNRANFVEEISDDSESSLLPSNEMNNIKVLEILKDRCSSMIQPERSVVSSAIENGQIVKLTEAGKLAFNSAKPNVTTLKITNNKAVDVTKTVSPVKVLPSGKKVIQIRADQLISMTKERKVIIKQACKIPNARVVDGKLVTTNNHDEILGRLKIKIGETERQMDHLRRMLKQKEDELESLKTSYDTLFRNNHKK